MKILAYILSIMVVVLTVLPCADKPLDKSLAKVEITQQTEHSHPTDVDHCSPFCSCQCCQASMSVPAVSLNSIPVSFTNRFLCADQNFESSYYFDFYIPPKV